jgi:hypothetical protein
MTEEPPERALFDGHRVLRLERRAAHGAARVLDEHFQHRRGIAHRHLERK